METNLTFEEYMRRYAPWEAKSWDRQQTLSWDDLKVGDKVMTLKGGYGSSSGGQIRTITEKKKDDWGESLLIDNPAFSDRAGGLVLRNDDPDYHASRGNWCNCIYPMSEEELVTYNALPYRQRIRWQIEKFGREL